MADSEENPADRIKRLFQARPGEDAAQTFLRIFKEQLRPDLIKWVSDDLFQKGRERELAARVEQIVDARLTADKIPIGRQLRLRLLESLLADIERARRERFGEN